MNEELKDVQARLHNLRADLIAQRILMDAIVIAMTPNARDVLLHNFSHLSEQSVAGALATVRSEEGVEALQRAIEQTKLRLQHLPRSS